jgi:integrase/recombinase XerD
MKLLQSIDLYVEKQRAAGMDFGKGRQSLRSFGRHVGDVSLNRIRPQQVACFLDGPRTSNWTWVKKYNLLRNFFHFCAARDLMLPLQLPAPRRQPPQTFAPYIYSRAEVLLLLSKVKSCQEYKCCRIDAHTLRTFLLFLYGTGALVGEARRLSRRDVDLARRIITIRDSHQRPTRTIPIGPDLLKILSDYCCSHHTSTRRTDRHFFARLNGDALNESSLNQTFKRLCRLADITRHDGIARSPRMHDLRYTFAVHCLNECHKCDADLNLMIPALSAYLGYIQLGTAIRFLRLTPERFRPQLGKLSPNLGERRWKDDSVLMHFLTSL